MTRRRRGVLLSVGVVAVVAAGVVVAATSGGSRVPDGMQPVDFHGLRLLVPDSYVVQRTDGKVDGELACPDADGFLFADSRPGEGYGTCDPPGDEALVHLSKADAPDGRGPVLEVNGVRYRLHGTTGVAFVDLRVVLSVHHTSHDAAVAKALLRRLVAQARPSPGRGKVPPTAAPRRTTETDRLADRLRCTSRRRASTYSRVDTGFLGRQKEAPLDCYVGEHGFRILVLAQRDAHDAVQRYYDRAWLVVGEDWIVTALDEEAARLAADRVGGTLRPPPGRCCGPPTSDQLPGRRQY